MSKSAKKVSTKGQDARQSSSVYDFLYHDPRRVASFLAQFDDSGHLQQIKQSESASSGAIDQGSFNAGINAAIIKSGFDAKTQTTFHEVEALERIYDPLWTNALMLLDYLAERNMIQRDLNR